MLRHLHLIGGVEAHTSLPRTSGSIDAREHESPTDPPTLGIRMDPEHPDVRLVRCKRGAFMPTLDSFLQLKGHGSENSLLLDGNQDQGTVGSRHHVGDAAPVVVPAALAGTSEHLVSQCGYRPGRLVLFGSHLPDLEPHRPRVLRYGAPLCGAS